MPSADPKSVKVHLTSGEGVEIDWKDGHLSTYRFPYLRDACPCALCDEERATSGRGPGQPVASKPGELPMFKPKVQPISVEPVGKYAMKFNWNDGHQLDRKSTRLNSSHLGISYAVFCLKKKT